MVTVIKCINTNFAATARPSIICSSIIGRTAAWYHKEGRTDVEFIEKNNREHHLWLEKNNIFAFPSLLFYKDGKLKYSIARIMAQIQIMEVIESL